MAILWAGGEDLDYAIQGGRSTDTTGGRFRSGWARNGSLFLGSGSTAPAVTFPFPGGAVTSAWLSCQYWTSNGGGVGGTGGYSLFGFCKSGTQYTIGVGTNSATTSSNQLCIMTWDGSTRTMLASTSGYVLGGSSVTRIDMQVSNYGATGTVNLYVNGTIVATYTGNIAVGGNTSFDSIIQFGGGATGGGGYSYQEMSEIFVSDSDTRAVMGLQTLAPAGAGTTAGWTNNTYTNINGNNYNDGTSTYVNTTGTDQEYTVTAPTPSTYSVTAVVISARMAKSASSTPSNVKLGYGVSGTGYFGTGASKAVTNNFTQYIQIDAINPATSAAFTPANISALQLDLQSA